MARAAAISGGRAWIRRPISSGARASGSILEFEERLAVGGIGVVAEPVVGPGRADVGQAVEQPAIARGGLRRLRRPPALDGDLGGHLLDLLAHVRLDARDQQDTRLLDGGRRGIPRGQVAHRRPQRLAAEPRRLLDGEC